MAILQMLLHFWPTASITEFWMISGHLYSKCSSLFMMMIHMIKKSSLGKKIRLNALNWVLLQGKESFVLLSRAARRILSLFCATNLDRGPHARLVLLFDRGQGFDQDVGKCAYHHK